MSKFIFWSSLFVAVMAAFSDIHPIVVGLIIASDAIVYRSLKIRLNEW